jgi:hypothetical protein
VKEAANIPFGREVVAVTAFDRIQLLAIDRVSMEENLRGKFLEYDHFADLHNSVAEGRMVADESVAMVLALV